MTRLNETTLLTFREHPQDISLPHYDRRAVTPGIVHIGVGGFHRAHEAVYLDDLIAAGDGQEWGICGVGLRPADKAMRDALLPQDCLYTMVARDAEGDGARIIGSLVKYLFAPEEGEAVLDALASPLTRIVSLTITEGGYNFNESTGEFNADHPDIQHDLADPEHPVSVFGYLAESLDRRWRMGEGPFTVLSCDNLPHNGNVARKSLLAFAALR
ncbi:MAG: mannitol dehydrogenase family protein, partial [Armatimonadota bacterium]|nr:mannitol dehydrogenase family protein [Armatimonadota bacterium]